jgi:hypothetical protein
MTTNFKEAYAKALREAITILGDQVAIIIVGYMQEKYGIKIENTADNPNLLSKALDAILNGGARVVKRRILRQLYENIGLEFTSTMTIDFEQKINDLKQEYEKRDTQR